MAASIHMPVSKPPHLLLSSSPAPWSPFLFRSPVSGLRFRSLTTSLLSCTQARHVWSWPLASLQASGVTPSILPAFWANPPMPASFQSTEYSAHQIVLLPLFQSISTHLVARMCISICISLALLPDCLSEFFFILAMPPGHPLYLPHWTWALLSDFNFCHCDFVHKISRPSLHLHPGPWVSLCSLLTQRVVPQKEFNLLDKPWWEWEYTVIMSH